MDLNDLYQSLATFWDKISPVLFTHLVAFASIWWIRGTQFNILPRFLSYLGSYRYKKWREVLDEFSLRPTLPYLLVIGFLIYLTLFNSLLLDSLNFRPISLVYSESEFWEENRPVTEILEIATYKGNPNIRVWEVLYAKQTFLEVFQVRYPEQFKSSVNWLVTHYIKWLTYYKCAILFLILYLASRQFFLKSVACQ
jgi:hypothetical protein